MRTVLWGHGFSKEESPRRQRLRDSLARLSDAVLFYDRVTEAEWRKRNPDQAKKAFTAPNAIDTAPVDAAIAGWDARALHDFRLAEGLLGRKILLFCSRLDPANRVDLLIKSLPALRERVPDVLACVIGAGSRELTRLKELAERLDVTPQVRFLGPIYDEAALAPWFMSSSLFCYPANAGLSVLHAMSYGLPVVTSDDLSAQNPEVRVLREGVNGKLYRNGSAVDLACRLQALLHDDVLRSELSDGAYRSARTDHTISKMVRGFRSALALDPVADGCG